jgi:molecular chaperone Hsp33
VNLFVTGCSLTGDVTGRIFTEDVREPDRNFLYSQTTTEASAEPRLSTLEVDNTDPVAWIARFYEQSEQRPARCFRLPDEHFALVAAQPDCDLAWLEALDEAAAGAITEVEETKLLETRNFRFHCGCDLERILPILGNWRNRLDELFHGEPEITIQCPRCAASYRVSREQVVAS